MIPLNGFEKYAGIGKILADAPKIIKYPLYTLGVVGAGAATLGIADRIHDFYNITSEMRKRKVVKKQTNLLQQIADQGKKEKTGPFVPKQKPIIEPLT